MKRCAECQEIYSDDLNFCLLDGQSLTSLVDSSPEDTLIRPALNRQVGEVRQVMLASNKVTYALFVLCALIAGGGIVFLLRPENRVSPLSATGTEVTPPGNQISETVPNLNGKWVGTFSGKSATLILSESSERRKYSGILNRTKYEIAIEAQIMNDGKTIVFDEKSVIKGKGWGTLGKSKGIISGDAGSMIGNGQDEHGNPYSWAFSK